MDDIALADLRVFLAVAREGSFTRAGTASFLTPSAISRAIRRLEVAVGTELVLRDGAGMHGLTRAGERFVEGAGGILRTAAAAVQAARLGPDATELRLALPGLSAALPPAMPLLPRVRSYLRRTAPEVTVRFVGVPFAAMWRVLLDEHVDVVLNAVPNPDSRIVSTRVAPMERFGLVGRRHELAGLKSMPATLFAEQRLMTNPTLPRPWMAVWTLDDIRDARDGELASFSAPTMPAVLTRLQAGREALVTQGDYGRVPGPYAEIALTGAPPVWHWIDRRRSDRRPGLSAVIRAVSWALTPKARATPDNTLLSTVLPGTQQLGRNHLAGSTLRTREPEGLRCQQFSRGSHGHVAERNNG